MVCCVLGVWGGVTQRPSLGFTLSNNWAISHQWGRKRVGAVAAPSRIFSKVWEPHRRDEKRAEHEGKVGIEGACPVFLIVRTRTASLELWTRTSRVHWTTRHSLEEAGEITFFLHSCYLGADHGKRTRWGDDGSIFPRANRTSFGLLILRGSIFFSYPVRHCNLLRSSMYLKRSVF